jgi:hypothetical protein
MDTSVRLRVKKYPLKEVLATFDWGERWNEVRSTHLVYQLIHAMTREEYRPPKQ